MHSHGSQIITADTIHSEQDVRNAIISNKIVIIEYFATTSEDSKTIAPVLVEYGFPPKIRTSDLHLTFFFHCRQSNREDNKDIMFGKVDVDELNNLAEEFGVTSAPTLQLFKNGERVSETTTPGPQALLQFIASAKE